MKKLPILTICAVLFFSLLPKPAFAAASVFLNGSTNGSTVTLTLSVTTTGSIDNAFDVVISYSGSVVAVGSPSIGNACDFPTPNNGKSTSSSIEVSCGTYRNFSGSTPGTIATIQATVAGGATFQIASATVLQADGHGTPDSITSTGAPYNAGVGATPTPTPTSTPTPSATPSSTQSPTQTQSPTATSSQNKGTSPTATQKPTATPLSVSPPGSFQAHPTTKPTVTTANQPSLIVVTQPPYKVTPTPSSSSLIEKVLVTPSTQSLQTLVQGYFNNTVAALLFILPILALLLMVAFMAFRMYQMGRRRQRQIELLFEHELGELAALESKMDKLTEKGGAQDFKEEFQRTKDQILKELKPEYIGNTTEAPKNKE